MVTAEEWARIEEEIDRKGSLREAVRLVPWVARDVPRDALDRVFAEIGGPFRLLWHLTRGGFARREAKVFRYV